MGKATDSPEVMVLNAKIANLQETIAGLQASTRAAERLATDMLRAVSKKEYRYKDLAEEAVALLDMVGVKELVEKRDLFKDASHYLKLTWDALQEDTECAECGGDGCPDCEATGRYTPRYIPGVGPVKLPGGGPQWIAMTKFFETVIREAILVGFERLHSGPISQVDPLVEGLRKKHLGY